jgi:hypothetical protein
MGLGSREGADLGLSTSLKAIEVEGVYRSLFDNLDDGFELLEIVRDAEKGRATCAPLRSTRRTSG